MSEVNFDRLTILLIDDEPFMRSLVERVLFEFGIRNILNAENGEDGLRIVRTRKKIDLIICDLEMPTMDGFAFVRELRRDADTKVAATPVLILTGHSDEDHVHDALALGVNGFLVKPISKGALESRVAAALKSPPIDPSKLGKRS